MKSYAWMDGKMVPLAKATVPLLTHSLHYGSAAFEGIRFYKTARGPAVFRLNDHIKRLFFSAATLGMKVPYTQKQVIAATVALVKKNTLPAGYIRPIFWYGEKMGLLPFGAPLHAAIACWPWGKYLAKDVVSVKISRFVRIHPKSSVMEAKISGHYANSILATSEARRAGYDEALLLDADGNVAEGPGENIFFVKGKTVVTPKFGTILPGITRDSVMRIARDLGFSVKEAVIKPRDVRTYNEAFFTGTAAEVNAIGRINTATIGTGKEGAVTRHVRETYQKTVHGEIARYKNWLTYA